MTGSAAALSDLERTGLFVVALDDDREWYRCHRLLRYALGWTHGAVTVDSTREVLRRAARWFEADGRVDDAVRHLVRAGDHDAAAALLDSEHQWFLDRGWTSSYVVLGGQLAESAVSPQLALRLAYAAAISPHHDRVEHWLDVCVRRTDADTTIVGWASPRAAERALRAGLATPDSDPERTVALSEEAVALEAAAGTTFHPAARGVLGGAYVIAGRFDEGAAILGQSWRQRGQGLWSVELDLQVAGMLSLCLLRLARHDDLDRVLAEAGPMVDTAEHDWGEAAAPVTTLLRLVQGRRAYEQARLDEARERLGHGLRFAAVTGRSLFRLVGLVFAADLELASGDRAAARAALVRAREIVDSEPSAPFAVRMLEESEGRIGRRAVEAAVGAGALVEELTHRELSVLRMLPGSASQREIGAALFLSINTVKAYNKSLYRKLGVGTRADAVVVARRLGLI